MKDLNSLALLFFLLLLLLLFPPLPSLSCEEEEGLEGGHVDVCAPRKDVHGWCEMRTCVDSECGRGGRMIRTTVEDKEGKEEEIADKRKEMEESEERKGEMERKRRKMKENEGNLKGRERKMIIEGENERKVTEMRENEEEKDRERKKMRNKKENEEKQNTFGTQNTPPPPHTTTTRDPKQAFPSSSVKCQQSPGTPSDLQCHFRNLYYHPRDQEFAFIRDTDSLMDGIDDVSDLRKRITLASVARHNAFMFHVTEVPRRALAMGATRGPRRVTVIGDTTLIFGRFKPDNLHHVFHDDLLPLYFTMKQICGASPPCPSITLLATDDHAPSPHHDLYLALTPRVFLTSDLVTSDLGWVRMRSAVVGLDKGSVWYQYGFGQPQGPTKTTLTGPRLREFATFMKMRLGVGSIDAATLTSWGINVANASVKSRTSTGVRGAVKSTIDSRTSTSASIGDVTSSVDPKTSTSGDISVAKTSTGVGSAVKSTIDSRTSTSGSISDVTSSVDPKTSTSGDISIAKTFTGVRGAVKSSIDSGTSTSGSISDVTSSVDPKTSISVTNASVKARTSTGVCDAVDISDATPSIDDISTDSNSNVPIDDLNVDTSSPINAATDSSTNKDSSANIDAKTTQSDPAITATIDDVIIGSRTRTESPSINARTRSVLDAAKVTPSKVVLIRRKRTRKILNEKELVDAIVRELWGQEEEEEEEEEEQDKERQRKNEEERKREREEEKKNEREREREREEGEEKRRKERKGDKEREERENERMEGERENEREKGDRDREKERESERMEGERENEREKGDRDREKERESERKEGERENEREKGDRDREKERESERMEGERENERKKDREKERENERETKKNKEKQQKRKINQSPPSHTQTHAHTHNHSVKILSLEENGLAQIIQEISTAEILIGLHGAALILGLFLPKNSLLIELWPFTVSPMAAPVYRAMCALEGSGITYMAWVNADAHSSYAHPEYPGHHGGLRGVASEERGRILHEVARGVKITSVTCCNDLDWLFRIYQDTVVRTRAQGDHHVSGAPSRSVPFEDVLRKGLGMVEEASLSSSEGHKGKNGLYKGVEIGSEGDLPSSEGHTGKNGLYKGVEIGSEGDLPSSEGHKGKNGLDKGVKGAVEAVPSLESPQYQAVPNLEAQESQNVLGGLHEAVPSLESPQYQAVPNLEAQESRNVLGGLHEDVPRLEIHQDQGVPTSEAQTVQIKELPSERTPQYQAIPTLEPHAQTVPIAESPQYQNVPTLEPHAQTVPTSEPHAQTIPISESPQYQNVPTLELHTQTVPISESPQYQAIPTSEPQTHTVLDKPTSTHTLPMIATHQEPMPTLERPRAVRPARVRGLTCALYDLGHRGRSEVVLTLTWRDPWTSEALGCPGLVYEVVLEYTGGEEDTSSSSSGSIVVVLVSEEKYVRVFRSAVEGVSAWVTCICAGVEGMDRHIRCGV